MKVIEDSRDLESVRAMAKATAGLDLLLLFGSRGRGDALPESDWDFAYLGNSNNVRLRAGLALRLKTDRVDLMDLSRAGGLARYRAARDGLLIFESREGVFEKFWFESVRFWLDARDVLEAGYDVVLENIDKGARSTKRSWLRKLQPSSDILRGSRSDSLKSRLF